MKLYKDKISCYSTDLDQEYLVFELTAEDSTQAKLEINGGLVDLQSWPELSQMIYAALQEMFPNVE